MSDQDTAAAAPLDVWAPAKKPVSFWLGRKRPPEPMHEADRRARVMFDVLFAGAKAAGRWEDDWPLMTEDEFDKALAAVANIKMGG
jgi:hypothetical protein